MIISIIMIVGYFTFVQYNNIIYNINLNNTKKEMNELNKKIDELIKQEKLLETNVNTSDIELKELQSNLTTLQNDLKTATDKLNSL
jgi:septal ring factor EnvC (AmiA/AmiB activator)